MVYLVYLYEDMVSECLVGVIKFYLFLSENGSYFKLG